MRNVYFILFFFFSVVGLAQSSDNKELLINEKISDCHGIRIFFRNEQPVFDFIILPHGCMHQEFLHPVAPEAREKAALDSLVKYLNSHPDWKVSIDNHTDTKGDVAANKKISQQRANKVKDKLVANGVKAHRLTATGYGEDKPLYSEIYISSLKTEEEKNAVESYNRRTHLRLTGIIEAPAQPVVYIPDTFIGLAGTNVNFAESYSDIDITWGAGKTESIIKPSKSAPVEKVSVDPKRFNSLEGLARVLKMNPELKIEIGCHSDAAESPVVNEKLTRERAENIRNKLIVLGVDTAQVRAVGYGGTLHVNWWKNAAEAKYIRRAEIRITGRRIQPEFSFGDTVVYALQKKSAVFLFGYNKWGLENDSITQRNLDSLASFMKMNPNVNVMLCMHTDSRGQSVFNQQLSLKRAQSIRDVLVRSKGIAANRISVFAAGEWNPASTQNEINKMSDKNAQEQGYAKSRRLEIIIDSPLKLK